IKEPVPAVVAFVRMDGLENCVNTQGNVTWPKMRAKVSVNQPTAYYAQERVPVTVENASVLPRNGTFQENSANVMTRIVTNMMALFAQEMVYVTVETASAGKIGPEMLVRSGSGLNIPNIAMKH
ncbi:hypothetical protein E2320_004814, partial [Naja naja]